MAEYKKGDIAHMSNNYRATGIANPGAETDAELQIKRFTLKLGDPVVITKVRKSKDSYATKVTGGAVYDGTHERDGQLYHIESIPQRALYSKAGWAKHLELTRQLDELRASGKA